MTLKHPRQKGNRNRLKAIKELGADGWLVDVVEKTGKFAKIKDLYGLFDLIGIREGMIIFVQVTTNRPHPHKPFKDFVGDWLGYSDNIRVEQWVYVDRKPKEVHKYA